MDLVLSKLHYNSSITVGYNLALHVATFFTETIVLYQVVMII